MKLNLLDWLSGDYYRKKLTSNARYEQSVQFAQTYKPVVENTAIPATNNADHTDNKYTWVFKAAIEEYERLEAHIAILEEKADSSIKFLGVSAGLIALYFTQHLSVIVVFPTLGMLFIALCFLSRAVQPEQMPTVPTTREALAYADAYARGEAEASFAAMVGAASIGLSIIAAQKAKFIRGATALLLLAVLWLIISAAFIHPPVHLPVSAS